MEIEVPQTPSRVGRIKLGGRGVMRELLPVIALALMASGPAKAGTTAINIQYGAPAGFSQSQSGCNPHLRGQCIKIPLGQRLIGFAGTITLKRADAKIELLSVVLCGPDNHNRQELLRTHQFDRGGGAPATIYLLSPPIPHDDNFNGGNFCWHEFQIISAVNTGPGAAFEIQLMMYTERTDDDPRKTGLR
jgi:hypothetical protein